MKRRTFFLATWLAVLLALINVTLTFAHPLGNFTVNRYAGLNVSADAIDIDYVIDMAEIPAYQEIMQHIGARADGAPDKSKSDAYRTQKCAELLPNLSLLLDGKTVSPIVVATALEFPPGAGGLLTLRLTCNYRAPIPEHSVSAQIYFHDANYTNRIGWREITVQGVGVRAANVPSTSISDRLKSYPNDLLTNPPNQSDARFQIDWSATLSPLSSPIQNRGGVLDRTQDAFAALIVTPNDSLPLILLALAIAIILGAAHAISPGHGKTIMAAYLVGARGTWRQALVLGLTVTITHTIGVMLLGLITLFASRYIVPESLYPWLSLISGALVVTMGIALVINRRNEGLHVHAEPHEHRHGLLGGTHSHLPEEHTVGLTWRSLVGLGLAGGIVPSTSALILLLSAISLHRIALGVLLIVAFGFGMASVLVGIGIALVRAARWIEVRQTTARWMRWMPLASAGVVIGAGLIVTIQAMAQMGWFYR